MMDKETFADIVFGRISDSIRHDLSTGTTKSHKQYIKKNGEDMPEIRNWKWGAS